VNLSIQRSKQLRHLTAMVGAMGNPANHDPRPAVHDIKKGDLFGPPGFVHVLQNRQALI
jgi:hypothetical protein